MNEQPLSNVGTHYGHLDREALGIGRPEGVHLRDLGFELDAAFGHALGTHEVGRHRLEPVLALGAGDE